MIETPKQLLAALDDIVPGFGKRWTKQDSGWSFSFCGPFMELTDTVRDRFAQMPQEQRRELMDFVESLLLEIGDQTSNELDTAACTCFLENLSNEPPLSAELRRTMGPKSTAFFNYWDSPKPS